jgi:hypothetical protein
MRRALHFAKCYPYALKCDIRRYFPSMIRHKRRRRENPEKEWGGRSASGSRSWVVWLLMVCLLLLAGGGLVLWLLRSREEPHRTRSARGSFSRKPILQCGCNGRATRKK